MEGRVVVVLPLDLRRHRNLPIFAARFPEFGLTSYAYSITVAEGSVKHLFNTFIRYYRGVGRLTERLNESGVEWYWEEEYRRPCEDTDDYLASEWPEPRHTLKNAEGELEGWPYITLRIADADADPVKPRYLAA